MGQTAWTWLVENILQWVVIGFAGWQCIDGIKDQKIGKAVVAFTLGALAFYYLKQPEAVLDKVSQVWSTFFGG